METAHSIFRPWRAQIRSDPLFTVINIVLSKFMDPFLALFRQTSQYLLSSQSSPSYSQIAQTMVYLLDIFYDLTCQDLPPAIEDNYAEFFGEAGWFFGFLDWDPLELRQDVSGSSSERSTMPTEVFSQMTLHPRCQLKQRPRFWKSQRWVVTSLKITYVHHSRSCSSNFIQISCKSLPPLRCSCRRSGP